MEIISCSYCGSKQNKPVWHSSEFKYVKCKTCGLVYQNPRPTFDDLKNNVYIEKYFQYELRNQNNFFHLMELNLKDLNFWELTKNLSDEKRFLDIGSATGLLLNNMKQKGWTPDGVELCKESAEYCEKHFQINVHQTYLENVQFPDNTFDAVHMSHVIEHVPSPLSTLKEIYRIMKKKGLFVIVTPNIDSFQARWFKENWRSSHKDHLTLFSTKTLRNHLQKVGFTIVKQFSYGGIGVGLAPKSIKKIVDFIVRKINYGDVTAFLCQK